MTLRGERFLKKITRFGDRDQPYRGIKQKGGMKTKTLWEWISKGNLVFTELLGRGRKRELGGGGKPNKLT